MKAQLTFKLAFVTVLACLHLASVDATELTFDIDGLGNHSAVPQEYGDNVSAATMGDFSYGSAEGYTPNVTVSYGPDDATPAFWSTGYGDLTNILFEDRDRFGVLEITFRADPGSEVKLHRWDMAAYGPAFSAPPTITKVQVTDGDGAVLFNEDDAEIAHQGHRRFDHSAAPFQAQVLVLRFESGNLGNLSDDIAFDNIVFSQTGNPGDCEPQRVTFDPGNERLPSWDPRGELIAFTTDREPGDWNDIGGVDPNGQNERLLAKGPQSPFGLAAGPLDWVGLTGQLITAETVTFHEYLAFDVSKAPFTRTTNDNDDEAFTRKLLVSGGGGGGFLKVSDDGSTALWRFSHSGGGGRTTIHTAAYSSLNGQAAGNHGVVHVDIDTGQEQRFLSGAAISPDGSFFILSQPEGSGHDLWLYTTDQSKEPEALTTTGKTSGALNRFPDISPDGSKVAFTFLSGNDGETNEIYLMDVDGNNITNLTNTPALSEAWPTWSPDGTSIAFGRNDVEGSPNLMEGESPNINIYTLCLEGGSNGNGGGNLPTGNEVFVSSGNTITYDRITEFGEDDDTTIGQMEISGDGSKIIFSTRASKSVYTMNADGSQKRFIFSYADFRGCCSAPWVAISYDGSTVAWTDAVNEIFTASSDGSNRREIATAVSVAGSTKEPKFGGGKIKFGKNGKLYFQIYMGRRGDAAEASGIFEINPDGSGLRKLFGFLDLWPVVPKEPDQSVDPGEFDVSNDGSRIILDYDVQDPSSFFGPGAFHPGAMVTWENGTLRNLMPTRKRKDFDVAISGDGAVVAYEFSGDPDLFVNTFAGDSEQSVIRIEEFNVFDFRLNENGTVISVDTSGTEGSRLTTLLATDGSQRLDLMPDHARGSDLVRMSAKGTRLVWFSGWNRLESGKWQIWTLDLNPSPIAPGFPQITNPGFDPDFLQQDGSSTTVMSANISDAPVDNWFIGMLDGEMRPSHLGGIGRFSFDFFDDGMDNDPTANDGRFHTKDVPAFREPELGTWTVRFGGYNGDKATVVDVPGMRIIDGLPEDLVDSDNDGTPDFLEDAFGTDKEVPNPSRLPAPAIIRRDDARHFGIEFTVADDVTINAQNEVHAGGFSYRFELSEDFLNWRPAGVEIIVEPGALSDGRVAMLVRLTEALLNSGNTCFIRAHVSK